MRYTDRIIKPLGTSFEMFKETEEPQTMPYRVSDIDDSHEKWQQANGRVNAAIYIQKQALLKASGGVIEIDQDESFDFSDIDALFAADGRGSHMLEYEFEAVGEPYSYVTTDGNNSQKWTWKHKMTGKTFTRFQNKSGKSFETGRCTKFLENLKKGAHPLAYARAQHILSLTNPQRHQVTDETSAMTEILPLDRRTILCQQVRFLWLHFMNDTI
jgi:hypothetical protein